MVYEDKIEKNIDKNDEYIFEKNEINSKMIRTFNPTGDMILLEMEGEAIFMSTRLYINKAKNNKLRWLEDEIEKKIETNESYYDLGINEFKMDVTSSMILIKNSLEPKILQILNNLSQMTNLELYKIVNNRIFDNEEGNETEEKH